MQPFEWQWGDLAGSIAGMWHWTLSLGKPLAIGLPSLALTLALIGYLVVEIAWRVHVISAWRRRARRHGHLI